ncbi:hypothetical protein ABD91_00805 [Lysinibacillus sphaericus]|uniref:hypothetical protein n=1 Tax=Lysinibacillus sphaericus TaxID=1421 RepID=UPI0018CCA0D9|nr:hypothetical protein [Lysinibacillus sphaericus]MBG9689466.1 hypothetical protein [Lysinibacillus sphaericus]
MNANMKLVRDWIIAKRSFETAIIELEGEYETVPDKVYHAYYSLSYLEKLKVFRNAVNHIIKNY